MLKSSERMRGIMRVERAIVIGIFFVVLLPSIAHAHDQKEYNILITENGLTPPSDGALLFPRTPLHFAFCILHKPKSEFYTQI